MILIVLKVMNKDLLPFLLRKGLNLELELMFMGNNDGASRIGNLGLTYGFSS